MDIMGGLRSNESFMRLFLGRVVTNAGDSMYYIAAMWLVWELTGSTFYTGVAGFLVQLPSTLQFVFGPLVDRWSLRRILVSSQLVQLVGVLVIPIAAWTGQLSVWLLLLVMPILEFINQFVYPAQNASLPKLVDDDELVRANSLFSFAYQGVDIVFNAVSGLLVAVLGAVTLFVLDATTFFVAIVLFFGLVIPDRVEEQDDGGSANPLEGYTDELREGLAYLRGSIILRMLLAAVVGNFVFGMTLAVLPAFGDALGGPEAYGLLTAAISGGMIAGTAAAARIGNLPFGYTMIVGYLLAGTFWFAAVVVPGTWATVTLFTAAWFPVGATNVMDQSMVQSAVDDTLLGRVQAVSSSIGSIMMPVGSFLGGAAAEVVDPVRVISLLAGAFVLIGLYYLVDPSLRSLPPIDETDESTLRLGKATRSASTAQGSMPDESVD